MSIGNFNEINENNEAKENTDNAEKFKNLILETPESYDDDFDKKLDVIEDKRDLEGDMEEKNGQPESTEKDSAWERLRSIFSKKESGEGTKENKIEDSLEQKSDSESFKDRFKVDNSDNQIEKQAAENMEKRTESSGESNSDTTESDSHITRSEGRSRAEEAYNRHYHIKDDER